LKVTHCELAVSAASPEQFPRDGLPEIALAGRSNVGKSSLVNRLTGQRGLARTSSQPGRTRLMNFYRINRDFYLVDVPGYGYARVSKAERRRWGRLIEGYLRNRPQLRLVLLVVDFRHPPTDDDRMMYDWLVWHGIPLLVVGTKADKVSRGHHLKHARVARETLGMADEHPFLTFSAETGLGRDELWMRIEERLREKIDPSEGSKSVNDPCENEDNG